MADKQHHGNARAIPPGSFSKIIPHGRIHSNDPRAYVSDRRLTPAARVPESQNLQAPRPADDSKVEIVVDACEMQTTHVAQRYIRCARADLRLNRKQ